MRRLRPDVDITLEILRAVAEASPGNAFTQSILRQYQERGGLSKKQLQGLYGKARRLKSITPAKLATLEAIILKKPEKTRSALPAPAALYQKDEDTGHLINAILERFPLHKQVRFLQAKYNNNEPLTSIELAELKRFSKLLK